MLCFGFFYNVYANDFPKRKQRRGGACKKKKDFSCSFSPSRTLSYFLSYVAPTWRDNTTTTHTYIQPTLSIQAAHEYYISSPYLNPRTQIQDFVDIFKALSSVYIFELIITEIPTLLWDFWEPSVAKWLQGFACRVLIDHYQDANWMFSVGSALWPRKKPCGLREQCVGRWFYVKATWAHINHKHRYR